MTKHPFVIAAFLFVFLIVGCAVMGIKYGFGAQCTKAGFEGADHELCVKRATKGGPVYLENLGRDLNGNEYVLRSSTNTRDTGSSKNP